MQRFSDPCAELPAEYHIGPVTGNKKTAEPVARGARDSLCQPMINADISASPEHLLYDPDFVAFAPGRSHAGCQSSWVYPGTHFYPNSSRA